jgi:hypothetical protein
MSRGSIQPLVRLRAPFFRHPNDSQASRRAGASCRCWAEATARNGRWSRCGRLHCRPHEPHLDGLHVKEGTNFPQQEAKAEQQEGQLNKPRDVGKALAGHLQQSLGSGWSCGGGSGKRHSRHRWSRIRRWIELNEKDVVGYDGRLHEPDELGQLSVRLRNLRRGGRRRLLRLL